MTSSRICDCFLTPTQIEDLEMTRNIDKMLKAEKAILLKQFKLLLLGTGESGKTTFLKQLQIIYGNGFTDKDRENTQKLLNEGKNRFLVLTEDDGENIKSFWEDEGVQQCYARSNEYQLIDPTEYFMTSIERLTSPNYVPTTDDILQTRAPTTNIVEHDFNIQKRIFRIIDVGGQKSERKKWLNVFNDVTSIIFLVAISEYDQTLFECKDTNRMKESIGLFEIIINRETFLNTIFILFLNKEDLFKKKILKSKFSDYFPEYKGAYDDVNECKSFVLQSFLKKNKKEKEIYNHYTCATDTKNIEVIFNAVKVSILERTFKGLGI